MFLDRSTIVELYRFFFDAPHSSRFAWGGKPAMRNGRPFTFSRDGWVSFDNGHDKPRTGIYLDLGHKVKRWAMDGYL